MSLLTRSAIQAAGKCGTWRTIRLGLKPKSTQEKVQVLKAYLLHGHPEDECGKCNTEQRWVQSYHYLNLMVGRRYIAPVYTQDLEQDRIRILKG
jgi:hypothetical protein